MSNRRVKPTERLGGGDGGGVYGNVFGVAWLAVAALCCVCAGCGGGGEFLNENDALRRERMELTERVAELEQQTQGLRAELAAARAANEAEWPDGVAKPICASVEIGGLSGGVDRDGDGVDDVVRVYLRPLDGRGRFVQTVGALGVTVVRIEPGEVAETVAAIHLDAAAFDAAYRSGVTGTHYSVEVPIGGNGAAGSGSLTVRVGLTDAANGLKHEAERAVGVSR